MALVSCGRRLNGLNLAFTRLSHHALNARLFSQRAIRPLANHSTFNVLQPSRHYFWYPTKSEPTKPSPTPTTSELNTRVANSNEAAELQDVAPIPSDDTATALSTVETSLETAAVPPLQFGDLAELGLITWTPAGFVRWSLELIQVSTGMPWFYTLVATTLLYRIILLPLTIKSLRNSARLLPVTPRMNAVKTEMEAAQKAGDMLAVQRAALKQKKIYADAGIEMGPMILNPLVQLPITLGLFFGIKKMCTLPVAQLKQSGLDILPDLTIPDPTFVLPVLATALINLQILVGSREMNLAHRPEAGHMMNFFRLFSILGIYFMGMLPSGVMVTLITGIASSALQAKLLQYPPLRRALDIPVIPRHQQGRLPTFRESFKSAQMWFRQKQTEANRAHLHRK